MKFGTVARTIEHLTEKEIGRYCMYTDNIQEIFDLGDRDTGKMIIMAFKFGFVKGQRQAKAAAKAERERATKAVADRSSSL